MLLHLPPEHSWTRLVRDRQRSSPNAASQGFIQPTTWLDELVEGKAFWAFWGPILPAKALPPT